MQGRLCTAGGLEITPRAGIAALLLSVRTGAVALALIGVTGSGRGRAGGGGWPASTGNKAPVRRDYANVRFQATRSEAARPAVDPKRTALSVLWLAR